MEVNFFLFKNFQVGNPNKQFQEEVPQPLLAHLHAPQGSSKASHKHMPRAGSQEIGNGLLGNPPCHPPVQTSPPSHHISEAVQLF